MREEPVDYEQFRQQQEREILTRMPTKAELLEEIREEIRSSRLALPMYRTVQEVRRYTMTVEDLDQAEEIYQQLRDDQADVFDYTDFVDTLVNLRMTGNTISYILRNGVGPIVEAEMKASQSGCGATALGALLAAGTLAAIAVRIVA